MRKKTVTSIGVMRLLLFVLLSFAANPCHGILNDTVQIGVILDSNSWVGKVAMTAIKLAVDDVNNDEQILNGTRLLFHQRHSQTLLDGAAAAVDLLKREVVAIIGAQTAEIAEILSGFGDAGKVPIVSFTTNTPMLSNHTLPYLVGLASNDGLEMKAISAVVKEYRWKRVVFIHEDDYFGWAAASSLSDALAKIGSEMAHRSAISATADKQTIKEKLSELMAVESRVFVAHISPDLGLSFFTEAQEMGMMAIGYVWITTEWFASVWDAVINASTATSVQGLLGVKAHIPNSNQINRFSERWKHQFNLDNPHTDCPELNLHGLLAYDTVHVLARAIGKLGSNTSLSFSRPNPPIVVGNEEIKVFQQGKELLQQIIGLKFTDVGGPIQLSQPETNGFLYEIVNMVGKSYQVVGYWRNNPSKLSRTLSSDGDEGIGPVIWPGRSLQPPRGWVTLPSARRLKIGVPIRDNWKELVTVTFDPDLNENIVTGFCKDVFDTVLKELENAPSYDLQLCTEHVDDTVTETYNNLIHQVYIHKFDGVLGDTTILANRSKIVDFSHPFSDSGLVMVVPTQRNWANVGRVFLQPFTPLLWCTTLILFIFTRPLVVLLVEQRRNCTSRVNSKSQLSTLAWFSSMTAFFTSKENIVSDLGRTVTIIWIFVAFILASTYTATLSLILTVERTKPTVSSVNELVASGAPVGYQKGSFVADYLIKNLGIAKSKLKAYKTPEEYAEALRKGPNRGGVAAIFDEVPYVRIFLSRQCGYTMAGPTYNTGGLGFAFLKGSPLARDFSTAILNLSETTALELLEAKYFNATPNCSDSREDHQRVAVELFLLLSSVTVWASMIYLFAPASTI